MTVPFFHSLYFPIYEFSKDFYSKLIYGNSEKFNALICTLSSMTSAIICDTITNPMWIVRVRHQTEYMHSGNKDKESFNIIKEIYKLYKNVNKFFFIFFIFFYFFYFFYIFYYIILYYKEIYYDLL
jgi:hypothetical protein